MKTFLFLGDSITDSHRLWLPEYNGLGDGYVKMLSDAAGEKHSSAVFINKGHDGFTLPSLLRNLSADCYPFSPDFITLLIGINDVAAARNTGAPLDENLFADLYDHLLDTLSAHTHATVLCMSPFIFPHPREFLLWIPDIKRLETIMAALSSKYSFPFLPLHDTLNQTAEEKGYDSVTPDGVHLTPLGHQILAELWIQKTKEYGRTDAPTEVTL